MDTAKQKILEIAQSKGIIRSRDISALGLPRVALTRMVREGMLIRIERGLYAPKSRNISEHSSLIEATSKCPQGIVCLLSALRVHNLTTQSPFEIWLAIPHKGRAPKMSYPPLRIMRFSGKALTEGVEKQLLDGVEVQVTNVTRTVVDCFKFRNKIGLDVALEALREAWDSKLVSMDELWRCASMFRVANVMRPYMETLS
ncbi:type IV toxin-antitoxin system AbiEi family antitoxin domain-containing protein [uncultured Gilvimarinus sp.]|uniref:type IV toxin-antitoxin system AbiEi family antitoxin domain-containing protein n=1 Tax=uncultured Gilvimarinus sp. TaxID=1689143 RepID=UPI0030ED6588|tara:strand:+ start:4618 stop:5217 length:600 start_codon:yes stop_codon:yes gene_type:complete